MEFIECTGKTVEDAIQEACIKLASTKENVEYEVIEKESSGFLGLIGGKPAKIKAWVKKVVSLEDVAKDFIKDVCNAMNIAVVVDTKLDKEERVMDINLSGDDMGVLIGKRGQTIDSLQYLVSLVVNKESEEYYRIKLDTENYRERRKQTLENLAKNIAYKVKRTKRSVSLEPMNPYERRVIHSALQNDKYVTTKSEGEEPYRHVVVTLKK
ncbi:MAG: protein jag [Lachnospiraceae bacterium]|nr:protein jag [Lachnospiraceae bacterium]